MARRNITGRRPQQPKNTTQRFVTLLVLDENCVPQRVRVEIGAHHGHAADPDDPHQWTWPDTRPHAGGSDAGGSDAGESSRLDGESSHLMTQVSLF